MNLKTIWLESSKAFFAVIEHECLTYIKSFRDSSSLNGDKILVLSSTTDSNCFLQDVLRDTSKVQQLVKLFAPLVRAVDGFAGERVSMRVNNSRKYMT